jgi:hypothetical protein
MTNSQILGTIEATNPVLTVAPSKEETERSNKQNHRPLLQTVPRG